ncbi:hypothetical protein BGZ60DRAFT_92246 [Tricladium varicosporioides]|nr:hypothetical protein BGZ60DRAFT_92246 [Hymenoscyphus varicosporioides]
MSQNYSSMLKEMEASQGHPDEKSDTVPSYDNHRSDNVYSESQPSNIPNYGSGLPSMFDFDSSEGSGFVALAPSRVRTPSPSPLPTPLPTPASVPLSLSLDKDLIFPNTIPATALYSLNFTLNSMGNSIMLRRSVPGQKRANGTIGKIVDKDLYAIKRAPFNPAVLQIEGQRKSTYSGQGILQMKHGLRGKYWECKFKDKVVLSQKKGVWEDGNGKAVASETNEISLKNKRVEGNPGLNFEIGTDDMVIDLLVAIWCAKMWFIETYDERKPTLSDG